MTKSVLLYGDSIIWGVNAQTGFRHEPADRVVSVLREAFGNEVEVVAEGHRGRTMFGENGYFPERDGLAQFGPIFASHLPIDVVVISLGTNDLNSKTQHAPEEIAGALRQYQEKMQYWCNFMNYPLPKVIVVSPTNIETANLTKFAEIFAGAAERVAPTVHALQSVAEQIGYGFIDARQVAQSIGQDGIHLDKAESRKFAEAIAREVARVLH